MEKNIILAALNEIGAEIGYPFYVFEDGSYSKSFVNGKMNYAMVVKKKFTAPGIGEKAARNIRSMAESAAAEGKNAQTPATASSACVSASYPRVPAGRRKLTPQEEDALKQAELDLLSHNYPDKQGLELVCEFGSPELLQKHLFYRWLVQPDDTKAWSTLLARTDLPKLEDFVKKNLDELSYPATLCQILLLEGNDNLAQWFIQKLCALYQPKNKIPLEKALVERCLKNRSFRLLEEYLDRQKYYPNHSLQPEAQNELISAAAKDKALGDWYKAYYSTYKGF